MFDALYRKSRLRVSELARSLTDEQLGTRVAGTPRWTGRQVVAHLVGVASDIVAGNLHGAPQEHWTAAQVTAREGRTVDELLAEWDEAGPAVEAGLADRSVRPVTVFDLVTHECDLRETFGLGRPPAEDVHAVAGAVAKGRIKGFGGQGTLLIRAGDREWSGGDGPPRTELTVEPYELLRGLISRRSRSQMRAWQWAGDGNVDGLIEELPVFGARDDDQPTPA
jgi:uncharacterized protein (TIGR03083 family)